MKVTIKETGQVEELSIVDHKSGVNWISDLMGNHGELPEYDDDSDTRIIDQESFDWWKELTTKLERAESRYYDLRREHDDPQELDHQKNKFIGNCDLEDLPYNINQFCNKAEGTNNHN